MKRIVLISLAAVVFVACLEKVPTGTDLGTPGLAISDGLHGGGNSDFFFLPPLVPDPSTSALFEPLKFNADVEPKVDICELNETDVSKIVASTPCFLDGDGNPIFLAQFTFTSGPGATPETVVLKGDHYVVNWHTDEFNLDAAAFYRISVSIGTVELAFADVDVGSTGKDLKSVITGEFIPLKDGRTLPVKFRIETAAVCIALDAGFNPAAPCATATLGAGESLSLDEIGIAEVDDAANISMQTCTDLRDRATIGLGRVDLRTFGLCVEIISLDLLPAKGTASLCNPFTPAQLAVLSDEQIARMTVHRFGEGPPPSTVALPHSEGPVCPPPPPAPAQALEFNSLERFVRFARNTWRAVSDQVRAWIEPAPLWARTMVRCNRGGCSGIGEFRSSFQVVQPASMDHDPTAGPLGDGVFGDILVGTNLTVKVNAFDSGELFSPPAPSPLGDPEAVEGVRLTFTATGGTISAPGPAVCPSTTTCTVETDGSGNAEVTLNVVLGANEVVVTGIGVATDGSVGTVLGVFGPSINDELAAGVPLAEGTLTFTATGKRPDLEITSLTISPTFPDDDDDLTYSVEVSNLGDVATGGSFNVEVALRSGVCGGAGVQIGSSKTHAVGAGLSAGGSQAFDTRDFGTDFALGGSTLSPGDYCLRAVADSDTEIDEVDEGDNENKLDFTVIGDFHDLRRDGDIVIYKNYNAWFGSNKDETVLQAAPFGFTLGTEYLVRTMSELSVAGGIPDATSLIIITSASDDFGAPPFNIPDQQAGFANLNAWVNGGGWLVVHLGDNDDDDPTSDNLNGYFVPGFPSGQTADDILNCTGLTLAVADHALIRGPDATLATADDLTNANIDMGNPPCFDNHGALSGLLPAGAEVLIVEQGGAGRDVYATYTLGLGRVIVTTQTMEFGGNPTRNLINHFYWAINGVKAPAAAPAAIVAAAAFDVAGGGEVLVNSDGSKRN